LGGTPAYMAPEQRAAVDALVAGRPIKEVVDGRADVFSLGLVLYHLLGGPVPLLSQPRLDGCNERVSVGLADIIHKCLADNPAARYADAASLAADLRRHLTDQSLRGVRNRSLKERWIKWRRRKPHTLAFLLLAVVAAALLVGGAYVVFSQRHTHHA